MRRWELIVLTLISTLFLDRQELHSQAETGIQFNLSTPGARSLAMGQAFLGLADDATAAYTNPAGLSNLTVGGPEVAVEVRGWEYSTIYPNSGHLGTPLGIGIDTVDGLQVSEDSSRTGGLSYLSVGYVLPRGITVALFRHQLANFRADYLGQGVFFVEDEEELHSDLCRRMPGNEGMRGPFNLCRTLPSRIQRDISVLNTGAAAAYEFALKFGGSISLGVGLSYYQSKERSRSTFFSFEDPVHNASDRSPGGFFGPVDTLNDNVVYQNAVSDRDNSFGLNAGFLWKIGRSRHWSLGGVFRQGPKFDHRADLIAGGALDKYLLTPPPVGAKEPLPKSRLRIPDVFGLGVGYSGKSGKLKIALDIDRVRYSQRLVDLVPNSAQRRGFELDDVNEIHLGLEKVFFTSDSLVGTFRLGAFHEPAHEPDLTTGDSDIRVFFPKGKDVLHWSGGLGLVVREDFQIDAALDISERAKTLSISLVRFF